MAQSESMLIGSWRTIAAGTSGLLLTTCFPKTGWTHVAWICLLPLLFAIRRQGGGRAFRLGFVCGLVHFTTLLGWINHTLVVYGHIPAATGWGIVLLLVSYLALFPALFAWWSSRVLTMSNWSKWSIPAVWVGLEYVRSRFLSGFPWELLGNSLYPHLGFIQIADWFGVYGISFVIVLVNLALYDVLSSFTSKRGEDVERRSAWVSVATAGIVFVHVAAYGQWKIQAIQEIIDNAPSIDVMVVQGNIDQSIKWDPSRQQASVEKYLRLSRPLSPTNPPDLVVWPETAAPFYMGRNVGMTLVLKEGIRRTGTWFLVGSPYIQNEDGMSAYFNSAFLFDPEGTVRGRYDKAHLVPFGEYVPFQRWLPFIGKLVQEVGDFQQGDPGRVVMMNDHPVGVLICYEQIFPDLSRQACRNGAEVLVSMTNDAWYGRTSAPFQHVSMAVFRAVENRRALIRSANTGISGFIDPIGRMVRQTDLFVDAVSRSEIPLMQQQTIYAAWGDWFVLCCFVYIIAVAASSFGGYRLKKT